MGGKESFAKVDPGPLSHRLYSTRFIVERECQHLPASSATANLKSTNCSNCSLAFYI